MNKKLLIAGLIGLVAAFEVQAKEWAFSMDALQLDVEVPVFEVAVPTMPESAPDRCDSAERDINELEVSVLDINAKYWAAKMKSKNFSVRSLNHNPGSDILDSELRARFYDRLTAMFYQEGAAEPNMFEVELLMQAKNRIERIKNECNG